MSWWLFTLLVSTYYTANLTAHFTVVQQPSTIETLSDLAKEETLIPITFTGSSMYDAFRMSDDPVRQTIYARMKTVITEEEAVSMVISGEYVLINELSNVNMMVAQNRKELMIAGKVFATTLIGFALPKGSALNTEVSKLMNIMREAGLVEKWRRLWERKLGVYSTSNDQTPVTLDIESLGGVFIVFAIFALVATLLLLLEIFNHNQNRRKRIPRNDVTEY